MERLRSKQGNPDEIRNGSFESTSVLPLGRKNVDLPGLSASPAARPARGTGAAAGLLADNASDTANSDDAGKGQSSSDCSDAVAISPRAVHAISGRSTSARAKVKASDSLQAGAMPESTSMRPKRQAAMKAFDQLTESDTDGGDEVAHHRRASSHRATHRSHGKNAAAAGAGRVESAGEASNGLGFGTGNNMQIPLGPLPKLSSAGYTSYGGAYEYESGVSSEDITLTGDPNATIPGSGFTEAEFHRLPAEEQKKQRRLIRNRLSAQLHRHRQRAHIDALETQVTELSVVIDEIRSRLLAACDSCRCGALHLVGADGHPPSSSPLTHLLDAAAGGRKQKTTPAEEPVLVPAALVTYTPPHVPGILGYTGPAGERTDALRQAVLQGLLGPAGGTKSTARALSSAEGQARLRSLGLSEGSAATGAAGIRASLRHLSNGGPAAAGPGGATGAAATTSAGAASEGSGQAGKKPRRVTVGVPAGMLPDGWAGDGEGEEGRQAGRGGGGELGGGTDMMSGGEQGGAAAAAAAAALSAAAYVPVVAQQPSFLADGSPGASEGAPHIPPPPVLGPLLGHAHATGPLPTPAPAGGKGGKAGVKRKRESQQKQEKAGSKAARAAEEGSQHEEGEAEAAEVLVDASAAGQEEGEGSTSMRMPTYPQPPSTTASFLGDYSMAADGEELGAGARGGRSLSLAPVLLPMLGARQSTGGGGAGGRVDSLGLPLASTGPEAGNSSALMLLPPASAGSTGLSPLLAPTSRVAGGVAAPKLPPLLSMASMPLGGEGGLARQFSLIPAAPSPFPLPPPTAPGLAVGRVASYTPAPGLQSVGTFGEQGEQPSPAAALARRGGQA